jgi:hypothetical protein
MAITKNVDIFNGFQEKETFCDASENIGSTVETLLQDIFNISLSLKKTAEDTDMCGFLKIMLSSFDVMNNTKTVLFNKGFEIYICKFLNDMNWDKAFKQYLSKIGEEKKSINSFLYEYEELMDTIELLEKNVNVNIGLSEYEELFSNSLDEENYIKLEKMNVILTNFCDDIILEFYKLIDTDRVETLKDDGFISSMFTTNGGFGGDTNTTVIDFDFNVIEYMKYTLKLLLEKKLVNYKGIEDLSTNKKGLSNLYYNYSFKNDGMIKTFEDNSDIHNIFESIEKFFIGDVTPMDNIANLVQFFGEDLINFTENLRYKIELRFFALLDTRFNDDWSQNTIDDAVDNIIKDTDFIANNFDNVIYIVLQDENGNSVKVPKFTSYECFRAYCLENFYEYIVKKIKEDYFLPYIGSNLCNDLIDIFNTLESDNENFKLFVDKNFFNIKDGGS